MLCDTHVHLDFSDYDEDRQEVIRRAEAAGVVLAVNVGFDAGSSERSVALARVHPTIRAAVGIHPHGAARATEDDFHLIEKLAGEPGVVALGEMGLDYYRDRSPRPIQREVFRRQILMAKRLGLPIVVHSRDAFRDTLSIMKEEGAETVGGVFHCFVGDWKEAQECIEMGFYLAIGGVVTYPNARYTHKVATRVPLEKLVLETDCPFLAPSPFRGRRNEPAYVARVARRIAELRGMLPEEVARATTANVFELFGLPQDSSS